MQISNEMLDKIENEYMDFRKTPCYEERKAQLEFADFARSIIEKLVQKDFITNENLTALIQMFGCESKIKNVKKDIDDLLNFDQDFSVKIFKKFIENGLSGFADRGKIKISGLTNDELIIVYEFLTDISKPNSEDTIKKAISDFEKENVPQVKYEIYSPWLYYLYPTICPIVTGPVKEYLAKLGWDTNSYLDAWDMLNQINQAIEEDNYGYLDAFIYHGKCEVVDYWLFIVPKEYEDGKLWKYCKHNSIAAMQYQYGHESDRTVTINLGACKQIKIGDRVIVYGNNKTIGGIGEVTRRFFNDQSKDNGFDGIFGQRIGIKWITEEFEIDIAPIWNQLSKFKNSLALKTIHKITEEDYTKIFRFVVKAPPQLNIELLLKKKQIILYGPPGTGKTYQTKAIAVQTISHK